MKTIINIGQGRLHTGERNAEGLDIVIAGGDQAEVSDAVVESILNSDRLAGRKPRIVVVEAKPVAKPVPKPAEPIDFNGLVLTGRWMADRVKIRDALGDMEFPRTKKEGLAALTRAGVEYREV